LFAALVFVQVPQWDNDWTKCSVSVPDTACHWYVVNPDNTFGKGFSWITAPEFDVAALNDIGAQHEVTVSKGYQTTVELMNANSNVKYGDDYSPYQLISRSHCSNLYNTIEVAIGYALPHKQSNQSLIFTMLGLTISRQRLPIRHHTIS
jgi:hypothetical protein